MKISINKILSLSTGGAVHLGQVNSMQKAPWSAYEPRTFLLPGNSANKCAIIISINLYGNFTKFLFLKKALISIKATVKSIFEFSHNNQNSFYPL